MPVFAACHALFYTPLTIQIKLLGPHSSKKNSVYVTTTLSHIIIILHLTEGEIQIYAQLESQ